MDSRFSSRVTFEIDYNDFDDWVHELYPDKGDFEIACALASDNDTSHKINVEKKDWNKWAHEDFDDWVHEGKESWVIPRLILEKACQDGLIEEGVYYIRVSW